MDRGEDGVETGVALSVAIGLWIVSRTKWARVLATRALRWISARPIAWVPLGIVGWFIVLWA